MPNSKSVDFGEQLSKREFTRITFKRLWTMAVPDQGQHGLSSSAEIGAPLHDLSSLRQMLDIRDDGVWLSKEWLLLPRMDAAKSTKGDDDSSAKTVALTEAEAAELLEGALPVEPDGLLWAARQEIDPLPEDLWREPRLRFPFSAVDLAAFLLDGPGYFIAEAFGGLQAASPDFGCLGLSSRHQCGRALEGAWKAFKLAEKIAGSQPLSAQQRTAALRKGEPNLPVVDLEAADRNHAKNHKPWRRQMVKLLWDVGRDPVVDGSQPHQGLDARLTAVGTAAAVSTRNAGRRRAAQRDVLVPTIERAQRAVADRFDTASVMAELEKLARLPQSSRPPPLAGVTSGGVQWLDGGVTKTLTRRALGERLRRNRRAQNQR
jgi:hypothetical protein